MGRLLSGLLLVVAMSLFTAQAHADPGDEYTISILTMAPGSEVFFKFGHNAVLVHDANRRGDYVFNWGTFSFDEDGLIVKFLRGKLTYWLSVFSLPATIYEYKRENRSIEVQELDLTAPEKLEIVRLIKENAKEENKRYKYDYYRDNCSTRVRDLIDKVTDGALHRVSNAPARMTFRGQTSRLTADLLWAYVALNVAMGSYIDEPVTEWEEMFVPGKLQEMLRKAETPRGPLVKSEKVLVPDTRPPLRTMPPAWMLPMFLTGASIGAYFFFLATSVRTRGESSPIGLRLLFGLPLLLLTFLTTLLGTIFVLLWCCTDHHVAWHNENLLIVSPLSVFVLVGAFRVLRGKKDAFGLLSKWAPLLAISALMGVLVKGIPAFRQDNYEMLALFVPIWAGLAAGVSPRLASLFSRRTAEATPSIS